jgi:hypothetical protein
MDFMKMQKAYEGKRYGLSKARLLRLKAILQGYVDRNEIAGGVVLVQRGASKPMPSPSGGRTGRDTSL